MPPFDLVTPATVDEAIAALKGAADGESVVLAGGSDLLLDLDEGRFRPRRVVSLRRLPWRTLDWNGDALIVGATLPLRSLEDDPDVRRRLPGLYQAVRAVGSVALRHRATLGGNLGRSAPASDLIPVLLALDAEAGLVGPNGERRLSVDELVTGSRRTRLLAGELVRSVRFPEARPSAYLWQRVRPANDISQVAVAVALSSARKGWRVAVGGVEPRPLLLDAAAAALGPGPPDAAAIARAARLAAEHAPFVTDRRATAEYRQHLVAILLARAVERAIAPREGAG
jgi:CO/xanthine dehydrogenase FAD-binding subunit